MTFNGPATTACQKVFLQMDCPRLIPMFPRPAIRSIFNNGYLKLLIWALLKHNIIKSVDLSRNIYINKIWLQFSL